MPVVNVFCGSYCGAEQVVRGVIERTGYKYLDDSTLAAATGKRFNTEENTIRKALRGKASIFDKFTHEKDRSLAYFRRVLADSLKEDDLLLFGICGLMVPRTISHVLNVCMIADIRYRSDLASGEEKISRKRSGQKDS